MQKGNLKVWLGFEIRSVSKSVEGGGGGVDKNLYEIRRGRGGRDFKTPSWDMKKYGRL